MVNVTLLAGGPLDIPACGMRGTVYRFEANQPLSLPEEEGPRFQADPAFQVGDPAVKAATDTKKGTTDAS